MNGKNKKILLVDDEKTLINSLSRDLREEGFAVITAENGKEAVASLQNNIFDLVITDLIMPELDGIKVLQEAKKKSPKTGVIILTGYGDMTSAITALRFGADDYLLKPCEHEELVIRANRCLDKLEALRKIKIYEEMLPVCCVCHQIRDDTGTEHGKGKWLGLDEFIAKKTNVQLSHTYCPNCYKKAMHEFKKSKS